MSDMPTIVTHHSINCTVAPWLAHLIIDGKLFGVRFSGSTEDEAKEHARKWFFNEVEHQNRLVGALDLDPDEVTPKGAKPSFGSSWGDTPKSNGGWGNPVASEHRMAGKVWLMSHALRQRLRVNPSEVEGLVSQGWVQAGPKTAFRE